VSQILGDDSPLVVDGPVVSLEDEVRIAILVRDELGIDLSFWRTLSNEERCAWLKQLDQNERDAPVKEAPDPITAEVVRLRDDENWSWGRIEKERNINKSTARYWYRKAKKSLN